MWYILVFLFCNAFPLDSVVAIIWGLIIIWIKWVWSVEHSEGCYGVS